MLELPAELIAGGVIISSTCTVQLTTATNYRIEHSNINILLNCTALANKHRCAMDRSVYLIPENHPTKNVNQKTDVQIKTHSM